MKSVYSELDSCLQLKTGQRLFLEDGSEIETTDGND